MQLYMLLDFTNRTKMLIYHSVNKDWKIYKMMNLKNNQNKLLNKLQNRQNKWNQLNKKNIKKIKSNHNHLYKKLNHLKMHLSQPLKLSQLMSNKTMMKIWMKKI